MGLDIQVVGADIVGWCVPATFQDTCAICKNHLQAPCLECESAGTQACSYIAGRCGHAYHGHCIQRWADKKGTCPMDGHEWLPIKTARS